MPNDTLDTCAVLGSGTMGAQIALSLAAGGTNVILWGRHGSSVEAAVGRIESALALLVAEKLVDQPAREILSRISTTTNFKGIASAKFVIEAVSEDLELKQSVLRKAEQCCSLDAITSSTTSAIQASAIQPALERPGNFCIAHYAQPAHLVALVEVVPGEATRPEVVEAARLLLEQTGKTPVLCPDIPGFLWARIQHAVLREFAALVGKGLTTPEACDTVLRRGYASRLPAMGAFEHADLAGLDLICSSAGRAVWADLSNVSDPMETTLGDLLASGTSGMSAGRGFYDWRDRDPDEFKRQRDLEIIRQARVLAGR